MKFEWTDVEQNIFDDNKCDVSQDTLLAYPYFNECFIICADARDYYLGALMIHNDKPIAFYSPKRMVKQIRYTVT